MLVLTYRILVGIFFKNNIMETLVKIIEEKMLLIEQLESQLVESQKEIKYQKDSKLDWYRKFVELEETLKTTDNE